MENLTTVGSKGIYHGLPTFPNTKPSNIIITGANGITGTAMVRVAAESPHLWSNIYAMSRRPPPSESNNPQIHPIAVDFLTSTPEEIAAVFKKENVKADYIFFASYVQPPPKPGQGLWSDTDEMDRLNVALLSNFITALKLASITPKKFLLQTGGKYYNLHLGPAATPEEEQDPRIPVPNFYYPQEDMTYEYTASVGAKWLVTRPGFILGAVPDAAMNILYPLAIYASVQKVLGRKLEFPGDIAAWETESHLSTARLIAFHAEWALLADNVGDVALNHSDGGVFAWGKFWPVFASWYGIEAGVPQADGNKVGEKGGVIDMPFDAPRGFGPPGRISYTFTFESWASDPENQSTYAALAKRHNLKHSPFDDIQKNFGVLDAEILTPWPRSISMNRSRKLGWHGFVDTADAIREVVEDMTALGMVPAFSDSTK